MPPLKIYAHRAGRGLGPENTLIACAHSLRLGVDVLDFDVGMTRDGVLVATHDVSLNPLLTRDEKGAYITESLPLSSLTFEELGRFDVGRVDPTSSYAAFFPLQQGYDQIAIPPLYEVIDFVRTHAPPHVKLQLEIKTAPTLTSSPAQFAKALYELLNRTDFFPRCEIQSFDFEVLAAIQTLFPLAYTTYLTYAKEGAADLPWIQKQGGRCWSPFELDVTKEQIDEAHACGLTVVPWGYPEEEGTEFNAPCLTQLLAWGVDGLITDRPDLLASLLAGAS